MSTTYHNSSFQHGSTSSVGPFMCVVSLNRTCYSTPRTSVVGLCYELQVLDVEEYSSSTLDKGCCVSSELK